MALKPGNLTASSDVNDPAFLDSMASEIESELSALMTNDGLPPLSMDPTDRSVRDRRRLFDAGDFDDLLGDQLLLAPRCPCRRLLGRLALYPHADLCSRLDLHSRAVRRAGEVALPPDAVTRPERDDLSSKCRPARVICLRVIPRIEPDGMLLRTPRPTPDQVRGQAFGIMLYSRPARRKAST